MSKQETYLMMQEQSKKLVDEAAIKLSRIEQSRQQAEQQLALLQEYNSEYQHKLSQLLVDGVAHQKLMNFHQFMNTLEESIKQQHQVLLQWQDKKQQAFLVWSNFQRQLNAYTTLLTQLQKRQQYQENRIQQKMFDEFATQKSIRRSVNEYVHR